MKAVPIGGAYAYFEENANASIKPGKRANVVILGKSPFEAKPMGIKESARCRQLRMGDNGIYKIINFAYLLLGIFKSNAETRGASLSLRLGRDLKGMSERPTAFLF